MSTVLTDWPTPTQVAGRVALAVTMAISGIAHAYLWVHGYRETPLVGPAFLIQGSAFVALAVLILLGGPCWLRWAAGMGALASLVAFGLSRTVGLLGFAEHGWDPPYGTLTVIAEALTVLLVAASPIARYRQRPRAQ